MARISLLFLLYFGLHSISNAQKSDGLEWRVKRLEKSLDSLKAQHRSDMQFHNQVYNHAEIETNTIRSRLALELNRNFTYFGYLYEGEADTKRGEGYQRSFYFNGYHAASSQSQSLQLDRAGYLKTVRQNLKAIKTVVVGEQTEPIKISETWTSYPNRLIIMYYDNSEGGEPLIIADTQTNSLKVRIDGILQEIGWE